MKRFELLLILIVIGLFSIYHFLPFGNYCLGIIDGILFIGLIILYIIIWTYEIHLNLQEKKYEKKVYDKSSLIITGGLILIFLITQNLNIFESKTMLFAKTQEIYPFELNLKENENFTLVKRGSDSDCHYSGIYKIKNDTLKLTGNIKNIKNIDTLYLIDKNTNELIPINSLKQKLKIGKTSP